MIIVLLIASKDNEWILHPWEPGFKVGYAVLVDLAGDFERLVFIFGRTDAQHLSQTQESQSAGLAGALPGKSNYTFNRFALRQACLRPARESSNANILDYGPNSLVIANERQLRSRLDCESQVFSALDLNNGSSLVIHAIKDIPA